MSERKHAYELQNPEHPSVGGTSLPAGKMRRGVYRGPIEFLKGEQAYILHSQEKGIWLCQFDNTKTLPVGYSHGWHSQPKCDFDLIE